jgi:hypothetical protein
MTFEIYDALVGEQSLSVNNPTFKALIEEARFRK